MFTKTGLAILKAVLTILTALLATLKQSGYHEDILNYPERTRSYL